MSSYAERIDRLEQIVREIQSGADVDKLVALMDEGRALHEKCLVQLDEAERRISPPQAENKVSGTQSE